MRSEWNSEPSGAGPGFEPLTEKGGVRPEQLRRAGGGRTESKTVHKSEAVMGAHVSCVAAHTCRAHIQTYMSHIRGRTGGEP